MIREMRDAPRHERLFYVDGLRAVAVLAVVAFHAWKYAGEGGQPVFARFMQMGAHGVDLFFVLSGFCLAYPYLHYLRANGSVQFRIAEFTAKRIARIIPPYWLALVTLVILGAVNVLQRPPPLTEILAQVLLLDRNVHYVAGPFWSLPVEFRWYFLFPLALLAFVRAPRFLLAVAIGSYILYDFSRAHETPDFGTFPAFLGGIWMADLHLKRSPLQRLALPIFLIYGLLAVMIEPDNRQQFYAVEPLGVMAIMAFVVVAGTSTPLRKLLALPPLRTIAASSYGIYLMHDPILQRLEKIDHVAPWLAAVAAVAASMVFSWLGERPFVEGRLRDSIVGLLTARLTTLACWFRLPAALTLSDPCYTPATAEVQPTQHGAQGGHAPPLTVVSPLARPA